jgi:hypothetical protein
LRKLRIAKSFRLRYGGLETRQPANYSRPGISARAKINKKNPADRFASGPIVL